MYKNIHFIIMFFCCVGVGIAQPKPPKVLFETMKGILSDTKAFKQTLNAIGVDTTIHISDILLGSPIPIYTLRLGEMSKIEIDTPVLSVSKFTSHWIFFLNVKGKDYCRVRLFCTNNKCEFVSASTPLSSWSEIRSAYPEESGINPIIIRSKETFVHFPQINKHNLTRLTDSNYRASLRDRIKLLNTKRAINDETLKNDMRELALTTDSYKELVDSRKVLSFLKERQISEQAVDTGLGDNK